MGLAQCSRAGAYPVLPPSADPPSHTCQLPARQYARHVPFWQIGNELPTTLGVRFYQPNFPRFVQPQRSGPPSPTPNTANPVHSQPQQTPSKSKPSGTLRSGGTPPPPSLAADDCRDQHVFDLFPHTRVKVLVTSRISLSIFTFPQEIRAARSSSISLRSSPDS